MSLSNGIKKFFEKESVQKFLKENPRVKSALVGLVVTFGTIAAPEPYSRAYYKNIAADSEAMKDFFKGIDNSIERGDRFTAYLDLNTAIDLAPRSSELYKKAVEKRDYLDHTQPFDAYELVA